MLLQFELLLLDDRLHLKPALRPHLQLPLSLSERVWLLSLPPLLLPWVLPLSRARSGPPHLQLPPPLVVQRSSLRVYWMRPRKPSPRVDESWLMPPRRLLELERHRLVVPLRASWPQ